METFVSLCKRRGFVFQSSEIYGGIGGFWDYGPLGVEMKNNIKRDWWRSMVQERDDVVGIEASIIMNPRVWEASGHVATFTDPMVRLQGLQAPLPRGRHRDQREGRASCPECGGRVHRGAHVQPHVQDVRRPRRGRRLDGLPAARRRRRACSSTSTTCSPRCAASCPSASPRSAARSATRSRPATSSSATASSSRWRWSTSSCPARTRSGTTAGSRSASTGGTGLGVRKENLRIREHTKEELSHYSKRTVDIEYDFPFAAWSSSRASPTAPTSTSSSTRSAPAAGLQLLRRSDERADRAVRHRAGDGRRPLLPDGADRRLREEEVKGEKRVVLRLNPELAPIKVAVLPLSRNEKLVPPARKVWDLLRPHFMTQYDDAQSIGRRYRRQDEIGTPSASPSTSTRSRTTRSRSATATRWSRRGVPIANLVSSSAAGEAGPDACLRNESAGKRRRPGHRPRSLAGQDLDRPRPHRRA